MNARSVATILGISFLLMLGAARPSQADTWLDPEPPLTWDATLACELVVLAKYDSHQAGELKLQVLDY